MDLLADTLLQFKTVDTALGTITDETDKAVNLTSADWCLPVSVYDFYFSTSQDITILLNNVLVCLTDIEQQLSYKIKDCIESINECYKLSA